MRMETEALGRAALEDCLGSVGGELEREVLWSCNALFFESGFVAHEAIARGLWSTRQNCRRCRRLENGQS